MFTDRNAVAGAITESTGADKNGGILSLPVVTYRSPVGKTSVYSLKIRLDAFNKIIFGDLVILGVKLDGAVGVFNEASDISSVKAMEYVITQAAGTPVSARARPVAGREYIVTLAVDDNGDYDLDPEAGDVIAAFAVAERSAPPAASGGGSGGCDAGFGAFALLFSAGAIAAMRGRD
jgi:hypothetical protein